MSPIAVFFLAIQNPGASWIFWSGPSTNLAEIWHYKGLTEAENRT